MNTLGLIYKLRHREEPLIVRAPGRINLIGEHTDYNDGFVLPAAIDKYVAVAVGKNYSSTINLYAMQYGESITVELSDLKPRPGHWSSYVLGVVAGLLNKGFLIGGFNIIISGDIPAGAGLSSSAALECATVYALNELFDLNLARIEMVKVAQQAEHEYAGVKCGIMDQFASVFGLKDNVVRLDCRSLEYDYVPLDLGEYSLLLLDTGVKHQLASSEYNLRRKECLQGVSWVQRNFPDVNSLRDVHIEMLEQCVKKKDKVIYKRCRYVIEENARLQATCNNLKSRDLKAFGRNLFATHMGLKNLCEVSCPELDFLVKAAENTGDVLGARMMGGGFGGCTLNLVRTAAISELVDKVGATYYTKTGITLQHYLVNIGGGAEVVSRPIYDYQLNS